MFYIIPSGLRRLSTAGLSDFGCTLSEKMTVPAGGNKWEWFKRYDSEQRYGSNEVPQFSAAHVDKFIVCAFGAT